MDEIKTRREQLEEQAKQCHIENPFIWRLFVKFTHEMIDRGFSHYSAHAIFERIRWETDQADAEGRPTFKINNNHRSFYARWFMMKYPQHDGFFRTRRLTSDDKPATDMPELTPDDYPYTDWRHDYQ